MESNKEKKSIMNQCTQTIDTTIEAKRLRAKTYDIAKYEERKLYGEQQKRVLFC